MVEFWEGVFKDKGVMWGEELVKFVFLVWDFFLKKGIKKVFVFGFGYGCNVCLFYEGGMEVIGIEIFVIVIEFVWQYFGM